MVKIFLAKEDDISFLYEIKSDTDNMYWTGHSKKPEYQKISEYYIKQIQCQNNIMSRKIYIIADSTSNENYGYLYLDPIDCEIASVSIAVIDRHSGKGIGRMAIKCLVEAAYNYGFKKLIAEIREDNVRSQMLFTAAGFSQTENYNLIFIDNIERELKMFEYVKEIG